MRAVRIIAAGLLASVLLTGCFAMPPSQMTLPSSVAQSALDYAMTRVSDPYVWAGQSPGGFDCSGLIIWAYEQAYPKLRLRIGSKTVEEATQDDLWRYNVVPVLPERMRPGDIVFITNDQDRMTHGGLFIRWVGEDEFQFINASSFYGKVKVDTWPVDERKRGQWFAGAGRLQTVR